MILTLGHNLFRKRANIRNTSERFRNGILSSLSLPDGEWDMNLSRIIARKQTKETKSHKECYVILGTVADLII